jgi:hypothetical protein
LPPPVLNGLGCSDEGPRPDDTVREGLPALTIGPADPAVPHGDLPSRRGPAQTGQDLAGRPRGADEVEVPEQREARLASTIAASRNPSGPPRR